MSADEFKELLLSILKPDTATVKAATDKLKKEYFTAPQSLGLLIGILVSSDEPPELRKLAATQARTLVPKLWTKIPEEHRPAARQELLQTTMTEENTSVRHANARVIAAIAKTDLLTDSWPDLPATMMRAAASSDVKEREVGTYVLFIVLEDMAESHKSQFPTLFELFGRTIHDPQSAEVRINTLLALSKMALQIDTDDDDDNDNGEEKYLANVQQAIPDMVGVLRQAIDAKDEERTMQCFECFQNLLEASTKVLNKHFRDLIQLMAQIAANSSLERDARTQAVNFMITSVLYRKLRFQALKMSGDLVALMTRILSEEDGDEAEEYGLSSSAQSLVSLMASQLPPTQVATPILDQFKKLAISSSRHERRAGLEVLGACIEGCPEFVDTQMSDLLPSLLKLLGDEDLKVREAAVTTSKELADQLPSTVAKKHREFMTAFAKNLNVAVENIRGDDSESHVKVAVQCCTAIDALVSGVEKEDLLKYLPDLVPHLTKLFEHPDDKIKQSAIGAIGSIAASAEKDFTPYFAGIMNSLQAYARLQDTDEELILRSVALDAMGDVAGAVGAEAFQRYVQPLMQVTDEGLKIDNSRVKESSFMFWGTLSTVYEENFGHFLPGVTQGIFDCLEQEDDSLEVEIDEPDSALAGEEVRIAGRKVKVVASKDKEIDEDDSDDDDDDAWGDITGVSPLSEEKEVALEALGDILSHTKQAFLPYFSKAIELIMKCIEDADESVRRAAISTVYRAYGTLWQLQPEAQQKWEPGLPLKSYPSDDVAKLGQAIVGATLSMYGNEIDGDVVIEISKNLNEVLKSCGPFLISGGNVLKQVTEVIAKLITKTHPCQQSLEDSDFEEEETSEDEFFVIETAFDAAAGLAFALGAQFAELWKILGKPIMGYASATTANERSAAVGSIADMIRGMKDQGVTPYTEQLLKLLLHRLSDEDFQVRSNAAYGIGNLIEHSDASVTITKAIPTILSKLEPLLHIAEEHEDEPSARRARDNAAGCASRMILRYPDSVPLVQVLPALVEVLPLEEDYEENTPVWSAIVALYKSENQHVQNLTPKILTALAKAFGPPENQLEDETRASLKQLVAYIHSKQPALVNQIPELAAVLDGN